MQLVVRHETRYRYRRPVGFGRHRLVLRPRESRDLTLLRYGLHIEPQHTVTWERDAHDNVVALVDFAAFADELTIVNEFEVRHGDEPAPAEVSDTPPLELYRQPTFPDDLPALQAWLAAQPALHGADAAATGRALCEAVHRTVAYRRRLEKGVQTPAQTLALGSGSCRDMTTLLMEAARLRGLAARFASGYLHGSASIAGRASTHAWAEIHVPGAGWCGLDPTLGSPTDVRHIPIGVSDHPRGVMPVSGTFSGTGADLLEHTVAVHTEETPQNP